MDRHWRGAGQVVAIGGASGAGQQRGRGSMGYNGGGRWLVRESENGLYWDTSVIIGL